MIYFFKGGSDGTKPMAGLIDVGGTLYGTTTEGGGTWCDSRNGCGTVFSATPAGVEKIVYSFQGDSDGAYPFAGLTNVAGTLYGVANEGGSASCSCGIVFSVTRRGVEKVLHVFQGNGDGAFPGYPLFKSHGTLYGSTYQGGGTGCVFGCGTLFSVTPAGVEKLLYTFQGGTDGAGPSSSLIDLGGTLYGTTLSGGSNNLGTLYSITNAGAETVVYSFQGGSDGNSPEGQLSKSHGALYGTTVFGGTGCLGGCGTVFSLTP